MSNAHHDYRGYAGHGRRRRVQARRRGRGAALRVHVDDRGRSTPATARSTRRSRRCRSRSRLADDIDMSRGDMICRPAQPRHRTGQDIDAMVCWITDRSAAARRRQVRDQAHDPLGAGAREGPAVPARRQHAAPRRERRRAQAQRDRPRSRCAPRRRCSSTSTAATAHTGSFILIDEATNNTVGRRHDPGRARLATWDTRARVAAGTEWARDRRATPEGDRPHARDRSGQRRAPASRRASRARPDRPPRAHRPHRPQRGAGQRRHRPVARRASTSTPSSSAST